MFIKSSIPISESPKSEDRAFRALKEESLEIDENLESSMREFESTATKKFERKESKLGFVECKDCDYKTMCNAYLKVHIDAVHKKIKHPCPECGKSFAQKSSLSTHKRMIHDGIKYQCDFCDYKSGTKGNLRVHTSNVHGITMTIV